MKTKSDKNASAHIHVLHNTIIYKKGSNQGGIRVIWSVSEETFDVDFNNLRRAARDYTRECGTYSPGGK